MTVSKHPYCRNCGQRLSTMEMLGTSELCEPCTAIPPDNPSADPRYWMDDGPVAPNDGWKMEI